MNGLGWMGSRSAQVAGAAAILIAAGLALPMLMGAAGSQPAAGPPTVTVYGTAALTGTGPVGAASAPMNINLNFTTTQATPKAALDTAQSEAAKIRKAVVAAGGTITGENFNINEQGGSPPMVKPGMPVKPPEGPTQFRADEGLNVQVSATDQLAAVITAGIDAGATGFNTYSQGMSSAVSAQDKSAAIAKAYQAAQSEAQALAAAEGGHLGPVAQAEVEQMPQYVGPGAFVTVKVTYDMQ